MRFKRQSKILFSMESVAITDIIMNMFIFFFITFSFLATFNRSREGHVDVSLPKATSASPPVERKSLSVSLTKDGGLFLNETPVSLEQLKTRMQEEKGQGTEVTLVVRADKEVQHGRVVEVMDIARNEGMNKLAIGAQAR
jgi:biopolymer transport protein ExbD